MLSRRDAHRELRMTLGHVYDMDLRKNENLIKEVIIQAQGEVSTLLRLELCSLFIAL